MDRNQLMDILLERAEQTKREFNCFSIKLQASQMAKTFKRAKIVAVIFPEVTQDGAEEYQHLLIKGTEQLLRAMSQEAAQSPLTTHRPTSIWAVFAVKDIAEAKSLKDIYGLRRHESAINGRPSKMTYLFWEEMTPGGWDKYAQTKISERYISYIYSKKGITLRKRCI